MLPGLRTAFDDKPGCHCEEHHSSDHFADQSERICLDPYKGLTNLFRLSWSWCHRLTHFHENGLHLVQQMAAVITLSAPPQDLRVDRQRPAPKSCSESPHSPPSTKPISTPAHVTSNPCR